jgi:hypothetical protein
MPASISTGIFILAYHVPAGEIRPPPPARTPPQRDLHRFGAWTQGVSLELQYLYEIRRTAEPARVVLQALASELGLKVCDLPFPHVIEAALDEGWTRDPFDRLVVAQAKVRDAPLVTKDREIHENYPRAVWSKTRETASPHPGEVG